VQGEAAPGSISLRSVKGAKKVSLEKFKWMGMMGGTWGLIFNTGQTI
jgi:hypothetical protein